ncbi:MAG TPA: class II aldolase/adducin family protein [Rhizobiaceae bacterium]|nr:class II aldolase/adducin family protein [Rhizobiaceae bacterium]
MQTLLEDLVKSNRILAHERVVDDFGHISMRHPDRPDRFFLSWAISPARVTRDDIVEYDLDGAPQSDLAGRRSYSERVIHAAIYAARPDVMAVCHHHSSAMIPFASSTMPLRPVYHLGAVMGAHVPVWDSRPEFGDTSLLVDDMPKARSLATALGENNLVLLRRHGVVVVGKSLKETVFTAIYASENAAMQQQALAMGEVSYLSPGEIEKSAALNLSPLGIDRSWPNRCIRAGLQPD